ncbi:restriction endonuclease subunit S [Streptomyces sp. NPDC059701]|uniref:restriction endonuclease subunit S n=1 Tax=Streptomyces sp. NPDC059701 TaxID=3346914 RepID=UPI0036760800
MNGWRNVRLKDLCTDAGQYGLNVSAENYMQSGVRLLRTTDISSGVLTPAESGVFIDTALEARFTLVSGDLLLSRSGTPPGQSYLVRPADAGMTFAGYLVRFRPRSNVDPRFLSYVARSAPFQGTIQAEAVASTIQNFNAERYSNMRFAAPDVAQQRRIADYLDTETARMDRLGSQLQQFDRDVREREAAVLSSLLDAGASSAGAALPEGWSWTPLMHLTDSLRQIMYGIVLPGPNVADGVPIVKGGDVAANRLTREALNRTTHEIEAGYARSRLKGGDLVIAIRGSVGEIAVVPDELTGTNLTQDAARISIGATTNADWLRLVLQSPLVKHHIRQRVTGATIKGINIWDLKRISVPTPRPGEQQELAREATRIINTHEALRSRVLRHQSLLAERRQTLITAAVTGQFDVSTASGRNVTEGVSI